MYLLIILLGMSLGSQPEISQDLYLNKLNMSFGINYKYNGLLHHNIDRVWVITKVVLPKLEDMFFPDIKFNPDCSFVKRLQNSRQAAKIRNRKCMQVNEATDYIIENRKKNIMNLQ